MESSPLHVVDGILVDGFAFIIYFSTIKALWCSSVLLCVCEWVCLCVGGEHEPYFLCLDELFIWKCWGRVTVYLSGTLDLAQGEGTSTFYTLSCFHGVTLTQWSGSSSQKKHAHSVSSCSLTDNNWWNKRFVPLKYNKRVICKIIWTRKKTNPNQSNHNFMSEITFKLSNRFFLLLLVSITCQIQHTL